MAEKRKIRKYKKLLRNPKKKKMPIRGSDKEHFEKGSYYNLDTLKFRSPYNQNYSNLARRHPDLLTPGEVFDEIIEDFLESSPFSREDLSFFRYGIFYRIPERIPKHTLNKIKDVLAGHKATIDVINEQKSDALLVRFGNNKKMIDAEDVLKGLDRNQDVISSLYDLLADYGDVYWGIEFETEEIFGDSR